MEQRCPRCGGNSFHYNQRRMMNVCDMCGYAAMDQQAQQAREECERTVAAAQRHLAAGNWSLVVSLVSPLLSQHPTDKRLYALIIRAVTKDYTDYEMSEHSLRDNAKSAWDRLSRLGGIDGNMTRYSRTVWQKRKDGLVKKKNNAMLKVAMLISCVAGSFALLFNNMYFYFLLGIFASIIFAGYISELNIKSIKQELSRIPTSPHTNPF